MHRREDLHTGTEQGEAPDAHGAHVEHDAVEVKEDPLTEFDIGAIVAKNGGCIKTESPPVPNSSMRVLRCCPLVEPKLAFNVWQR